MKTEIIAWSIVAVAVLLIVGLPLEITLPVYALFIIIVLLAPSKR